ncbi:hypothetical protein [Burkholderia metallica]|uniref:hypothetical protein n=1 Tax=Burkholderia metallica TaxID=488729 RepID=UPI00131B5AA7|nr:hypothetical protein [Burkholderia metallica]
MKSWKAARRRLPGTTPDEFAFVVLVVRMAEHGWDAFTTGMVVRGAQRRATRDVTGR